MALINSFPANESPLQVRKLCRPTERVPEPDNSGTATPEIEFFDFATQQVKQIVMVDRAKGFWGGLAISPDGQWMLFTRVDQVDSDIMLVENFR